MIKYNLTKKNIEIKWETGHEFQFIKLLLDLIDKFNEVKK